MKATETVGPVLIHIITEKGRGYVPAETASDKMHGVGKYDILTGKQIKPSTKARPRCAAPAGAQQGASLHAHRVRKQCTGAPVGRSGAGGVCKAPLRGWASCADTLSGTIYRSGRATPRARRAQTGSYTNLCAGALAGTFHPLKNKERNMTLRASRAQTGSYTNFFADALIAEAELDARVVGIHAAMGGGTGMNRFEKRFFERTFDVGIAEQARGRAAPHAQSAPGRRLPQEHLTACFP